MLWSNVNCFCNGVLLLTAIVTVSALYAYLVDSRRPDEDPEKRNYHPLAIFLAPVTFPLFIVFYTSLFILRVITYGVFIVLFIIALILIRQPVFTKRVRKNATTIGDLLLEANTLLIRIFLRPWSGARESA